MKIFPEEPKQQHRLRRFFMATGATAMVMLLLFFMYAGALIEGQVLRNAYVISLLLVITFFALLRSGLNLRASDPSLTMPMILASTLVLLYLLDNAPEARSLLILLYMVPFLFGVLRLSIAQMLCVAALFVAGYALVLFRDIAVVKAADATYQLGLQLCITGAVLFWFALFAGYIGRLRKLAADANASLESGLIQAQKMVSYDELTGLFSRRHILETLAREKGRSDRSGRGFCVLAMDLDHFKAINDNYGHSVGDATLRRFAECAAPILRPSDILARFGGEEFLLVGLDTDALGAAAVGERVRSTIGSMQVPGLPEHHRVTVSIGVAEFIPGESTERALQRADRALYAAKQGGRDRVVIAPAEATAENRV
jgi:diguanylate cyclase (GGDEF)-like protein